MVADSGSLHGAELLGRHEASAVPHAHVEARAAPGLCLSQLRERAAGGSFLEMRTLSHHARYLRMARTMSELQHAVPPDALHRLRRCLSHQPVGSRTANDSGDIR